MATQKYTIQKGDTLGALAKKFGVGVNEFSGYRSGDPNKIYEGETISYGTPDKAVDTTGSSSYVSELKSQLGDTGGETKTKDSDPYGLASIKTQIEDATKKRDSAFAELKDVSTKTFNDEYAKRGLEEKKTKMATLDSTIASKRAERDAALAKVRANPGLSAAQMTGDVKKLADFANDEINGLISERNSVASEYNTGLSEIDKVVSNTVKDKTLDYGYYDSVLKDLTGQVGDYTKLMREDLQNETQADQFDRQLAQALEIAQIRSADSGTSSVKKYPIKDSFDGKIIGWYDNDGNQYDENGRLKIPGSVTQNDPDEELKKQIFDHQPDTEEKKEPGFLSKLWNAVANKFK